MADFKVPKESEDIFLSSLFVDTFAKLDMSRTSLQVSVRLILMRGDLKSKQQSLIEHQKGLGWSFINDEPLPNDKLQLNKEPQITITPEKGKWSSKDCRKTCNLRQLIGVTDCADLPVIAEMIFDYKGKGDRPAAFCAEIILKIPILTTQMKKETKKRSIRISVPCTEEFAAGGPTGPEKHLLAKQGDPQAPSAPPRPGEPHPSGSTTTYTEYTRTTSETSPPQPPPRTYQQPAPQYGYPQPAPPIQYAYQQQPPPMGIVQPPQLAYQQQAGASAFASYGVAQQPQPGVVGYVAVPPGGFPPAPAHPQGFYPNPR